MGSRCDATARATLASSAATRSTISSGEARSIAAVRGLRCSVTRGSSGFRGTVMATMIRLRPSTQLRDVDLEDDGEMLRPMQILLRAGFRNRPQAPLGIERDPLDTGDRVETCEHLAAASIEAIQRADPARARRHPNGIAIERRALPERRNGDRLHGLPLVDAASVVGVEDAEREPVHLRPRGILRDGVHADPEIGAVE